MPPMCSRCQSTYSLRITASGQRGQREHGKHPLLLRCGHTFCRPCLRKCESSGNTVQCPTCQKGTRLCTMDLKPDMYTVGLLWARHLQLEHQSEKISADKIICKEKPVAASSAKPDNPCIECGVNTANCRCLKCESVMCRSCFDKIHQMSVSLRKHRPVPLQSFGPLEDRLAVQKARSRFCSVHDQCQMEYFCIDDNQPICSRCVIMGDHKGHDVLTLEDKNKECLDEMEPAMLTAQETIWRLEKSEQAIKQAMPQTQVDTRSVVEEVRIHFRDLHSLLQAREEQLVDDIKEAALGITKPFQETIAFLQNEKLVLEMALMDAARAKQSSLYNLVDADLILERLRKARDLACVATVEKNSISDPVKFSFDTAMKGVIGSYGTFTTMSATQMFTLSVPGPDVKKPPPEELRSVTLSDLDALSTDNESIADSASVIVEEEREAENGVEEGVGVKEAKTEVKSNKPGNCLRVGHSERVRVTHICTPAQFYVQLASQRSQLETMQRHLNQHCHKLPGKKVVPGSLQQGSMVLAQFSLDKNWYRATVMGVTEPSEGEEKGATTYKVFFMDYGNTETVTIHKLHPMKEKFESYPIFAYECKLFDICPQNRAKGWTLESANVILEMTSFGVVLMKVKESGERALAVDLIKQETTSQYADSQSVSLRDTLVFLELAVFNKHPPPSPKDHIRKEFITLPPVSDGIVTDISINCVETPSAFYAQMHTKSSSTYMQKQQMKMQDIYCQNDNQHRYTIFCPRMYMLCVAKYPEDSRWYRACVTGLPGNRKVQVHFVDFGNTEIVDYTDIRKILQEYVKFPQQAFKCSLVDVAPTDSGQWSPEALKWFRKTVDLQFGQMRIVGPQGKCNTMTGVLYVVSQENKLCCVNYEMVQRGFARSTGPRSQEESYDGVTLAPEVTQAPSPSPSSGSSSSTSSSPTHPLPQRDCLSPSKQERTPPRKTRPSPQKAGKSLPTKSRACRTITLRNLRNTPETKKEEEAEVRGESVGVEVMVSGYRSPGHFYIQLQEKQSDLLSLMTELAYYETSPPIDRAWKVGEFCMAKYSKDSSWYRAQITRQVEDDTYEVMLVDYGHVDVVPASELRIMKKTHATKECFSERCHLAGLTPAGSFDPSKWSATAIDFVADEIRSKRLFLKLEGDSVSDQGLAVDILIEELIPETALEPMRHEYVSLISRLQRQGLACPITETPGAQSDSAPAADLQMPRQELFHTKLTLSSSACSSPNAVQTGQAEGEKADDDDKANHVVKEEEEEVKEIEQTDCSVPPHPPPLSNTVKVFPVYVDYQGIIYAHDREEEDKITAILHQIDTYAKTEAPKGQLKVKVDQLCLAHFDIDSVWYRARVLDISQNTVKVKYIDFGNSSRVDKSMLRLITPELCVYPQIAYEFKLYNLKPETVDGSWPASFLEYMHNQLVNTHCTALIRGDRGQHPLKADIVYSEGESISATLLKIGVVSKENDMEDLYERYTDISHILKHSNPYFPLRPGGSGDVFNGLVTHMELPNVVYIQRCAAPLDSSLPEDVSKFIQMMDDLNNDLSNDALLEEVPAEGEMCCARFSEDDRWYRALVAKTYPHNQTALVFYVDYGNSEVVPLDRLQGLPQKFQDTPAQALRAFLNLGMPDGATLWTLATYKAMAEAVFLRRHIVLIKFTDPLTVELFAEDQQLNGAAVLSYQTLIHNSLVKLPKPIIVTDMDDDNVIVEEVEDNVIVEEGEDNVVVESYTEVEQEDSTVDPA